jgi:hypothetical protein
MTIAGMEIGAKTASELTNATAVATSMAARIGLRGGGVDWLINFVLSTGPRPHFWSRTSRLPALVKLDQLRKYLSFNWARGT